MTPRKSRQTVPPRPSSAAGPGSHDINALVSLFNEGRFVEGEAFALELTRRFPRHGFGWKALGALLKMQGRNNEALVPMQKAAELLRGDDEVQSNLGVLLGEMGRFAEAEACHRRALQIRPDSAETLNNLGNALERLGRFTDAEACYRRAIGINPDYAEAHGNLGNILEGQGRFKEAEDCLRLALERKPGFAEAHNNLGIALERQGRFQEAEACYRRSILIRPEYAEAHSNLGNILKEQDRLAEAESSYRRALAIRPDFEDAFGNLLFTLNYHPDMSAEEIFSVYREYDRRFGLPLRTAWREHSNDRTATRRLKVGYVSPDFRQHSARHFLEPLLAHHDKGAVEVHAYAELTREDAVTARYRDYADHWIATRGMTDAEMAERIRADGIDILVDLAGHTAGNRLQVFARRPAPVSASWLGFGYTTGLTAIDYILTDETSVPEGSENLFSEKPWRLETPGYVFRPAGGMGPVTALPAQARGFVTFGTLTRAIRINHRTVRAWSEILRRVDGARLVVDSRTFQDAAMVAALAAQFSAQGIARDRLEIGFHSPPWDVLRGLDIGLDCFPHNSGTTLFESLYMGVPYVTLADRPGVGRLGSSIIEGVAHPEWISRTEEEYIEKSVALASDLPGLASIRAGLRSEMEAGALMDEAGFARKMEVAYRAMWIRWCGSMP